MSGARPYVHPRAVVDGLVDLGDGVEVMAGAVVLGPVRVGARTRIYPNAVIGCPGEHRTAKSVGWINIGADCEIRESVTVQRGTGERDTTIGDRCLIMAHGHLGHDVVIGDDCTLSPGSKLGGHSRIHDRSTLGMGCVLHQHTTIGFGAMVGAASMVTKDVPPFALVMGNPARWARMNTKALQAWGAEPGDIYFEDGQLRTIRIGIKMMLDAFETDSRRAFMAPPAGLVGW